MQYLVTIGVNDVRIVRHVDGMTMGEVVVLPYTAHFNAMRAVRNVLKRRNRFCYRTQDVMVFSVYA